MLLASALIIVVAGLLLCLIQWGVPVRDRPNDHHRKVAAAKMSRPLKPGEDVHHKDNNKANNRPENLDVMPHGEHTKTSVKGRKVAQLVKSLTMRSRGEKLY